MKDCSLSDGIAIISTDPYVRERLNPQRSDPHYLHLSDLLCAIKNHATTRKIRVLDFGCGGSPYKPLFPNADYYRADFSDTPIDGIDYLLDKDSKISALDNEFDYVLSTQVAEHVSNPESYFREIFRILKPGGTAVITTHGFFHEHGCPYDFQRWTANGLARDVRHAGMHLTAIYKLTCGRRAFLYNFFTGEYLLGKSRPLGFLFLRILTRISYLALRSLVARYSDFHDVSDRVRQVDLNNPDSRALYVGLLIKATKSPSIINHD